MTISKRSWWMRFAFLTSKEIPPRVSLCQVFWHAIWTGLVLCGCGWVVDLTYRAGVRPQFDDLSALSRDHPCLYWGCGGVLLSDPMATHAGTSTADRPDTVGGPPCVPGVETESLSDLGCHGVDLRLCAPGRVLFLSTGRTPYRGGHTTHEPLSTWTDSSRRCRFLLTIAGTAVEFARAWSA